MTELIKNTTKKVPDVRPGDVVRVHVKIKEGGKERQQVFEGVIIKRQGGNGNAASILVRKISEGIGVEKKFMLMSPFLAKIEVKKRSSVKRADLSYLRNIRQVHRHLKDRKIEPFEAMLVEEAVKEKVEAETKKNEESASVKTEEREQDAKSTPKAEKTESQSTGEKETEEK